jgi:hypothetical protein
MTGLLPSPLLVAALAFLARPDDPKHSQGAAPLPLPGATTQEDPHAEMRRAQAGAPPRARAEIAGNDGADHIDSLLEKTLEQSRSAISGIDRILKLADHPHPGGGT